MKPNRWFLTYLVLAIANLCDPAPIKADGAKQGLQAIPSLEQRCQKMLAMQIGVLNNTRALNHIVATNQGQKPNRKDIQVAAQLAEQQKAILLEVTICIGVLKAEGSAAAFPEVFEQLAKDMQTLQAQFTKGEVGEENQAIQQDLVDTFKEMISALKKPRCGCG